MAESTMPKTTLEEAHQLWKDAHNADHHLRRFLNPKGAESNTTAHLSTQRLEASAVDLAPLDYTADAQTVARATAAAADSAMDTVNGSWRHRWSSPQLISQAGGDPIDAAFPPMTVLANEALPSTETLIHKWSTSQLALPRGPDDTHTDTLNAKRRDRLLRSWQNKGEYHRSSTEGRLPPFMAPRDATPGVTKDGITALERHGGVLRGYAGDEVTGDLDGRGADAFMNLPAGLNNAPSDGRQCALGMLRADQACPTQASQEKADIDQDSVRERYILDSLGCAVVAVDLDGRLSEWNKGAERISGLSRREVLGKRVNEEVPKETDGSNLVSLLGILDSVVAEHESVVPPFRIGLISSPAGSSSQAIQVTLCLDTLSYVYCTRAFTAFNLLYRR